MSSGTLCMSLSEETLARVGACEGMADISGRDKEIAEWINAAGFAGAVIGKEFNYTRAGFLLGYALRGYDNLCDFRITFGEVVNSLVLTHMMQANGGVEASDLDNAMATLLTSTIERMAEGDGDE